MCIMIFLICENNVHRKSRKLDKVGVEVDMHESAIP